MEGIVM